MRRYALILIAAVALAGCTALPGGDTPSDRPPARGLVIEEARLQNTVLPSDGSTQLVLRLANTQPDAVQNVDIGITNTGAVSVSKNAGQSDSSCPAPGGTVDSIGGAVQGVPTQLLCVWDVEANGASSGTYPLTVTVEYTNTLTMQQESPKIRFDPDQQIPAAKTSRTYSNGELSMAVSASPRLPADASEVVVDTTLKNVGAGRIVDGLPECRGRCARLTYSGSLRNDGVFDQFKDLEGTDSEEQLCRTVRFLEGESSSTTSCTFAGGVSGGLTTHSLRMTARYRYRLVRELPLQVLQG